MPSITLRGLARKLGLGKSTVQRALADSARVSKATRERVKRQADKLGYRHDVYFAALSARKSRRARAGTLLHYFYGSPRDPSFAIGINRLDELRRAAMQLGFDVQPVNFREFPDLDRIPHALWARGSAGLIVGPTDPVIHPGLLACQDLPIICCERQGDLPFYTVRAGVLAQLRLCWAKLWEAGYRRIGCAILRHDPLLYDDRDRIAAALALLEEHLRPEEQIPPFLARISRETECIPWLKRHRPEALIGFHHGFAYRLRDAGLGHVPFVCLLAGEEPVHAHIPGTIIPPQETAIQILRLMDTLIQHGETGTPAHPVHIVIPPVWFEGAGIPVRE